MSAKRLLLPFLAATVTACSEPPSAPEDVGRPPVILQFVGPPGSLSPGDTVTFDFTVRDSTLGEKYLTLRFDGAFSDAFTFTIKTTTPISSWYVWAVLPPQAEPLRTAVATLIISNEAGLSSQRTASIPILDTRRPVVQMALGNLRFDETIGTGQSLDIHVNAGDNHRLQYIGFRGGGLRDSVPATSTGDSHTFRITVPAWWTEPRPIVRAWARDASGLESVDTENSIREMPVYDWRDHPVATVPLTNEPPVTGVLWDSKRSVAYVLRGARIEVIQPTGSLVAPILLPSAGHAFTLTDSGDSLVVTLPEEKALGVVDLLAAARPVSVVPLVYQDEPGRTRAPKAVAVSGSHVFVSLVHGLYAGRILDVNLGARTQVIRGDFNDQPDSTDVESDPSVFRLPDGRVYVGPQSTTYYDRRFVYWPQSDRFLRTHHLRPAAQSAFSASSSGRFMLGNSVFDDSLNTYVVVEKHDWKEDFFFAPEAALTPNGNAVWLATHYGIAKFNLTGVFPVEQINLGMLPQFLIATPDGNRLIAVGALPGTNRGEQAVKIIDLRVGGMSRR